jgi:hypothetical protein
VIAALTQRSGADEAVAAIISRTATNEDFAPAWESPDNLFGDTASSILHQGDAGRAAIYSDLFRAAHFVRGKKFEQWTAYSIKLRSATRLMHCNLA